MTVPSLLIISNRTASASRVDSRPVYSTEQRATIKRTGRKAATRVGWLAALFALVAAPAAAEAASWRERARHVATDTFGTPACGQPRIIRADPATYAPEQADWLRSATAWADPERCAIVISSRERIYTSWRFCHVVVHEWGHLVGVEHSENPADVMYEAVIGFEGKVKVRGRWRWAASGFYRPCKPRKVKRIGGQRIGGWTT